MRMVNEIVEIASHGLGADALRDRIRDITYKFLPRVAQPDDNLTSDAYGDPAVKLMRSEAYRSGCYGCVMTHFDRNKRRWKCKAEEETGLNLNYPNVNRFSCEYGSTKK